MWQFLKSELLWQLLGGFAVGTVGMLVFSPSGAAHTLLHHISAALGVTG